MKYKEKYKVGMVFRSKEYPYMDIEITYVNYSRDSESAYMFDKLSVIDWARANDEAFCKHICENKGIEYSPNINWDYINTFPCPYWGEMTQKSMDAYLKKYKLELVGMSNKEIEVYSDDESRYCAGFKRCL